jgi:hypothetical protein
MTFFRFVLRRFDRRRILFSRNRASASQWGYFDESVAGLSHGWTGGLATCLICGEKPALSYGTRIADNGASL